MGLTSIGGGVAVVAGEAVEICWAMMAGRLVEFQVRSKLHVDGGGVGRRRG